MINVCSHKHHEMNQANLRNVLVGNVDWTSLFHSSPSSLIHQDPYKVKIRVLKGMMHSTPTHRVETTLSEVQTFVRGIMEQNQMNIEESFVAFPRAISHLVPNNHSVKRLPHIFYKSISELQRAGSPTNSKSLHCIIDCDDQNPPDRFLNETRGIFNDNSLLVARKCLNECLVIRSVIMQLVACPICLRDYVRLSTQLQSTFDVVIFNVQPSFLSEENCMLLRLFYELWFASDHCDYFQWRKILAECIAHKVSLVVRTAVLQLYRFRPILAELGLIEKTAKKSYQEVLFAFLNDVTIESTTSFRGDNNEIVICAVSNLERTSVQGDGHHKTTVHSKDTHNAECSERAKRTLIGDRLYRRSSKFSLSPRTPENAVETGIISKSIPPSRGESSNEDVGNLKQMKHKKEKTEIISKSLLREITSFHPPRKPREHVGRFSNETHNETTSSGRAKGEKTTRKRTSFYLKKTSQIRLGRQNSSSEMPLLSLNDTPRANVTTLSGVSAKTLANAVKMTTPRTMKKIINPENRYVPEMLHEEYNEVCATQHPEVTTESGTCAGSRESETSSAEFTTIVHETGVDDECGARHETAAFDVPTTKPLLLLAEDTIVKKDSFVPPCNAKRLTSRRPLRKNASYQSSGIIPRLDSLHLLQPGFNESNVSTKYWITPRTNQTLRDVGSK